MLHIPNKSFLFGSSGNPSTINYCRIIACQFGRTEQARIQPSSCIQYNVEQFQIGSLEALNGKYTVSYLCLHKYLPFKEYFLTHYVLPFIERNISQNLAVSQGSFLPFQLGVLLYFSMVCQFICLRHNFKKKYPFRINYSKAKQ